MHAGLSRTTAALVAGGWHWETSVAVPLLAMAAAYAAGGRALSARRRPSRARRWKTAAFAAGCVALALALLSSLDLIASDLFTAHMVQHELLMAIAAPLLVAADPGVELLWALPRAARRRIGAALSAPGTRRVWHRLTRPADAWLLHAAAIWIWHVPPLFQAALANDAIHLAQHAAFFGSGVIYWSAVLHPRRREELGISVLSLFGTAVQTAALGALLATSHVAWYPAYGDRAAAWGMTAVQDQQLAGLVMWIPAGFVYLAGALFVLRRWMRRPAWSFENAQQMERLT